MHVYKVLLTDHIAEEVLDVFDKYDDIKTVLTGTPSADELLDQIADYHAIIVRSPTSVTRQVIEAGVRLKFIGRAGVGVDNIDVAAASERGIIVMNSPRGNIVSTAEHTIALIMALARRVVQADRSLRSGKWERSALKGVELCGKTLGIIGLGRVGWEVARRMLAFSMDVICADPFVDAEKAASIGVDLVGLEEVLRRSHFITVHVPKLPETKGMISSAEIEKMRDGVFLINCARGGVVDEAALAKGLTAGKVAGVAFDVYETEPPGVQPLFDHERSVFTPHVGSATPEAQIQVAVDVARNVADALGGREIRDAVNRSTD